MSLQTHPLLDNPIWNALTSTNRNMCLGNETAKYFRRDIGWFAGLKAYNQTSLLALGDLLSSQTRVILFTEEKIKVPDCWEIKVERALLQMIHEEPVATTAGDTGITALADDDIPSMLELTDLTKPGPFFQRTIEFGNYEGIFQDGKLIAMAGQRLQPFQYTEISAVCTHPEHTGKGCAAKLLNSQLAAIYRAHRIPFLHLYPENSSALSVYRRLGFTVRKEMVVYLLEKKDHGL